LHFQAHLSGKGQLNTEEVVGPLEKSHTFSQGNCINFTAV